MLTARALLPWNILLAPSQNLLRPEVTCYGIPALVPDTRYRTTIPAQNVLQSHLVNRKRAVRSVRFTHSPTLCPWALLLYPRVLLSYPQTLLLYPRHFCYTHGPRTSTFKDYHGRNSDKFMEANFFLPFSQYLELYIS